MKLGNKFKLAAGIFFALVLAVLVGIPRIREKLRNRLVSEERSILAKASVDLTGQEDWVDIVKVKTVDSLALEVYFLAPDKSRSLEKVRIVLPNKRDGYFEFQGVTTNLAIADLDGDGILELLAPTYDEKLLPHILIYRFNSQDHTFSQISAKDVNL